MTTKTIEKTAKPRSMQDIQADIAKQLRINQSYEAERNQRLRKQITEVDARRAALEVAQQVHMLAQADDPATQMLATGNERLEMLKQQAMLAFTATAPRTWKENDGAGFQYRAKSVTRIADQPGLAKHLIEKNLWEAAGASLSVDSKLVGALLEKSVALPGVAVVLDVSVALYQPNKEN